MGDAFGALTTSTLGSTNVSRMSSRTCAVRLARTSKGAESAGMNPVRVALTTYLPAGTSGNETCPAPSVVVLAITSGSWKALSSTSTPDIRTVPSSTVTVTTTRPVVVWAWGAAACWSIGALRAAMVSEKAPATSMAVPTQARATASRIPRLTFRIVFELIPSGD